MLIAIAIAGAAMITAWWLWLRATLPEGEPSPKWGDLRPLRKIFKGRSIIVRMAAVAVLAGAMTIPMGFIYDLTRERYDRYVSVISEISSSWGSRQTLIGPVLCVPYTVRYQQTEASVCWYRTVYGTQRTGPISVCLEPQLDDISEMTDT